MTAVTSKPGDPPAGPAAASGAGRTARLTAWLVLRRTTPGRLALVGTALALLSLLVAGLAAAALAARTAAGADLAERSGPLSAAGQQIYRALSDADATAASAFLSGLSGSPEPPALRQRYAGDVAAAGAALARAEGGAGDVEVVARMVVALPVYTGLVETARVQGRLGYPVGGASLAEASGYLRSTLLPAAEGLYRLGTDRVAADQSEAAALPWLTLGLGVALLAGLVLAQRWLTRRTQRTLNLGLLAATAAVLLGLLWQGAALGVATVDARASASDGSVPLDLLARARIAALTARADETLALVARDSGTRYESDYAARVREAATLLAQARALTSDPVIAAAVDEAGRAGPAWLAVHTRLRAREGAGDHAGAVALATGTDAGSAGAAFARTDATVSRAVEAATARFTEAAASARAVQTALAPGLVVLGVVAAAGVGIGIGARLREYQ